MSSRKGCKNCGCTEIDEDPARGDAVCTRCGSVLEENVIVNEIEFIETGGGGHALSGQFVSSEHSQRVNIGGLQGVPSRESREVTLQNGRRRIEQVASMLRLNQHCIDTAYNFYKQALQIGLTQGRRSMHVVGACLYMTCRLVGSQHLLLDFSDALQVNVYELGKVLSFFCRKLYITLPNVDPCSYVMRFANALQFGDKEHEVAKMAMRLVKRMQKDWMSIGRRPTGLCGAALLLAARYFNFNRTIPDIVRIVQIGESAVRNRLSEFALTASSALTLDEFQAIDLDEQADPPAFTSSKLPKKIAEMEKEFDDMTEELMETGREVEKALDNRPRRGPYAQLAKLVESPVSKAKPMSPKKRRRGMNVSFSINDCGDEDLDIPELKECAEFLQGEQEEVLRDVLAADDAVLSKIPQTAYEKYHELRPTLESLGIKSTTKESSSEDQQPQSILINKDQQPEAADTFSDISDSEIDGYLLTAEESQLKAKLWMAVNGQFLEEQAEKRRKKQEELDARPAKKKRVRQKRKPIIAATAGEAIQQIVQEKKLSSKINYEVLKNLSATVSSTPDHGSGSVWKTEKLDASQEKVIGELKPSVSIVREPEISEESEQEPEGDQEEFLGASELFRRHQHELYGEHQGDEDY